VTPAGGCAWLPAMLPLEGTLLEKLRKIEALHAGTNISGEREAARRAAKRIRARLAELRSREVDIGFITACRIRGSEDSSSPCVAATDSSPSVMSADEAVRSRSAPPRHSSTRPSGPSSLPSPTSSTPTSTS
jgi:hypothetical protein